jgi:putative membrane protein
MKKWIPVLMTLALATTVAACDRGRDTRTDGVAGTEGAAGTTGESSLGMMEQNFVKGHLEDGAREVELGRLAEERATSPQVKEFARTMVADHSQAAEELRAIARSENIELDLDQDSVRDERERLAKLSGAEFDREYMEKMVDDHEKAVNDLERHVDSDHPQLRQFASSKLPVVRQHLNQAKQIHEQLDNRNDRSQN